MAKKMQICWVVAGLLVAGMTALPAQAKETLCYFLIDAEGNVKSYRDPPYPIDSSGREATPEELEKRKKMGHLVISMTSQSCGKENSTEPANNAPANPDKPVSPAPPVAPKPPAAATPATTPPPPAKPPTTQTPVAPPVPAVAAPPATPPAPIETPALPQSPAQPKSTVKEVSKFLGLQPSTSGSGGTPPAQAPATTVNPPAPEPPAVTPPPASEASPSITVTVSPSTKTVSPSTKSSRK